MIALKKVYGDELLRLALVLSLLKTDPSDYLQQEALLLSPGLHTANGSDWSFQHEPQTLIRPPYIHPKSLDHTLMDYERWLFEELNSLGRYYDAYGHRVTRDGDERMSNLNGGRPDTILHTYLVNNVATDTVAPTLLESVAPPEPPRHDGLDERPDPHDGVSDDSNVAHEVKVSQDESEDESESTLEPGGPPPDAVVTLSPGFLHNRSDADLFADIQSRSFDVSEFLVTPPAMHIKQELADEAEASRHRADDEAALVKREPKSEPKSEPLYGDDAMDDFVPYFAHKSESSEDELYDPFMESVYRQNAADLQDYDETLETLTQFKSHLEYLDVKQQQEDLEQYLLENTPLDCDEVYDLAPMFEEESALEVKRERASTSFTSEASSSGVSEMDNWEVCSDEAVGATETVCSSSRVKQEPSGSGDELTQEDMDLIEVLWKQDVDMGFSLDDPLTTPPPAGPTATKVDLAGDAIARLADLELKSSEQDDIEKVKASLLEPVETKPDDPWAGLSYTVDTETGEYVLQGELPSELVSSEESRFDLLEEALQLVELDDGTVGAQRDPPADVVHVAEQAGAAVKPTGAGGEVSETGEPKKEEEDSMLHPGMSRHAPPHHPHHPLAAYHHQSIMRQMSVEQRWQDLASLLSVPPPGDQQYHPHHQPPHHHHPHHYHHAHNIGSGGYAHAHTHNAHYAAAALAPPPPPADKHDNYGATAGLDGGYKVEGHPHQHDSIYYQHPQGPVAGAAGAPGAGGAAGAAGGVPGDMGGGSDGLLQAILNDDDLQLMDMAMNEGMYTMRMLDGGVVPHAPHPHPAAATATAHMMMSHERESLSDSAVSSMGSERVPSLSDGEWCDGGSDSAQDFHGSKFRPYEGGMCRGGAGGAAGPGGAAGAGERAPPQKKHHMFGKRCFQESPAGGAEAAAAGGGEPRAPLVKYEYPEQACAPYAHPHDRAVPLSSEYAARGASASLATQHAQLAPLTQPALHLHSLASPPHILSGGGVSEMARYGYGTATPERVRHNHTYSAPHGGPDSRPNVRDKRVRRLTDGSISDSGSSGTAAGHISRDEKRAKALGIPMTVQDIINLPMDEFNERLSKHDLSEAQLSLIRDIRRRGKNKVAAQNCRKRKLDQITSLADEVRTVRDRKQRLQRDHQHLMAERQRVKDRFAALYRHVFQNLRDTEGRPVSSAQYSLQQAADGNVVLVPKMHPSDQHMNRSSDDEMDRKKHYEQ